MTQPTAQEIATFLKTQAEMFSEGRIDDFMAAFRAIAPGGFKVQDPATGPVQEGWDKLEALCAQYLGWKLFVEDVKVSGNEAVIYVRNEGEYDGHPVCVHSIEHYIFGEDGSLLARYFHPMQ
ncbi:hypothetical protein N5J77_17055 [Sphingobium yanoikuyae]|uniref:SnoaL-like domain-containing protein n=1 Tax=Sphingobium yanoikuyae TaxID=13690 RepID=A0AA43BCT2_SPHYA|nr:hypothetical protein [Sphingobium yanoikuyae]MDH2132839.1 hypothetical protein [Sphingobium yanoikuyae]MDH2150956.1 hypothetical protein [Sphingobium yanoikuyae]MDH2167910.1 hypothetical protein [Sphingobium yanoikuyae]